MATFSVSGLSSGIDFSQLIEGIVEAERNRAITPLENKKDRFQTLQSLYLTLNTRLLSLENAVNAMNLSSEFIARKATSSEEENLSASAGFSAVPGSHTVRVNQLAAAEKEIHGGVADSTTAVNSSGGDLAFQYSYHGVELKTHSGSGVTDASTVVFDSTTGTGDKVFTFQQGSTTYTVTLTDDDATQYTLQDLVDEINNAAGGSVTAKIVNTNQLRLTGDEVSVPVKVLSGTTLDGTDGTADFSVGTFSAGNTRTLTVADGTTLEGLVDLINGDAGNPGVTASVLNDGSGGSTAFHLVLTGGTTGYDHFISVDSGTTLNGTSSVDFRSSTFTETQSAASAVLNVDGFVTGNTFQPEIEAHSGSGITDGSTVIYDATTGTGSKVFAFDYGKVDFEVTFADDDASQYTLNDLVSVINGGSVSGISLNRAVDGLVTASVVNTNQLQLTGNDDGVAITVTSDTTLDGTDGTVDFQSGQFSATQSAQGIVKPTNTVTDVVTGLTLDLLKADSTLDVSVAVNNDLDAIKAKINDFVEAYNGVVSFIREQTSFDPETQTGGPLMGELTVQTVLSRVRGIVTNQVFSSGTFTALSQIGLRTGSNGLLSVDDADLTDALNEDLTAVSNLFINNGTTEGVAQQLSDLLDEITGTVDSVAGPVEGLLPAKQSSLSRSISDVTDRISEKEQDLEALRLRLELQFASLESLLSRFGSQGGALTGLLG